MLLLLLLSFFVSLVRACNCNYNCFCFCYRPRNHRRYLTAVVVVLCLAWQTSSAHEFPCVYFPDSILDIGSGVLHCCAQRARLGRRDGLLLIFHHWPSRGQERLAVCPCRAESIMMNSRLAARAGVARERARNLTHYLASYRDHRYRWSAQLRPTCLGWLVWERLPNSGEGLRRPIHVNNSARLPALEPGRAHRPMRASELALQGRGTG